MSKQTRRETVGFEVKMTKHHRKPRSHGGTVHHPHNNIVLLSEVTHRAWHAIAGNKTPEQIAQLITEVFLDPEWHLIAKRR